MKTATPEIIRYVICDKTSGQWVASVFAERYEVVEPGTPSSQGCGHFWIGDRIVASVDCLDYQVDDSGGRMVLAA